MPEPASTSRKRRKSPVTSARVVTRVGRARNKVCRPSAVCYLLLCALITCGADGRPIRGELGTGARGSNPNQSTLQLQPLTRITSHFQLDNFSLLTPCVSHSQPPMSRPHDPLPFLGSPGQPIYGARVSEVEPIDHPSCPAFLLPHAFLQKYTTLCSLLTLHLPYLHSIYLSFPNRMMPFFRSPDQFVCGTYISTVSYPINHPSFSAFLLPHTSLQMHTLDPLLTSLPHYFHPPHRSRHILPLIDHPLFVQDCLYTHMYLTHFGGSPAPHACSGMFPCTPRMFTVHQISRGIRGTLRLHTSPTLSLSSLSSQSLCCTYIYTVNCPIHHLGFSASGVQVIHVRD